MKVEIEIPNGKYCRVWGSIHCQLNEDILTSKLSGICRYSNSIVNKDKFGQCKKNDKCPAYKE
jgi:hypothetical protein